MNLEVLVDVESAARRAAAFIADEARAAIAARGRFVVAVSGGRTPWLMLSELSALDVPWEHVHVFQVDERIAAAGDADRNLTQLRASLLPQQPGRLQLHAMPVESPDLDEAAARYGRTLVGIAGAPPVLDLVHLGLGPDGHTASLVPGDPVLDVTDAGVALTDAYQGRRRMTLTFPVLNQARVVLWLVTGADKATMLVRLRDGDREIPAGRVRQDHAVVIADRAAAQQLGAAGPITE
jgi:6-phosphogluconolactonase